MPVRFLQNLLLVIGSTALGTVLAFMMLVQELLGPVVTQRALQAASETHVTREG